MKNDLKDLARPHRKIELLSSDQNMIVGGAGLRHDKLNEILIRYPSPNVKDAVGYVSLKFKEKF